MEISGSASAAQLNSTIQVALQKKSLDQMKVEGAELNTLIASAATPQGSVNSSSQGTFIDAQA
jgi:hypothetical protein